MGEKYCLFWVSNFKPCLHFAGIKINASSFERQLHFCQKLLSTMRRCFDAYRGCKVPINTPLWSRQSRGVFWVLGTSPAPHAQLSHRCRHTTRQLSGRYLLYRLQLPWLGWNYTVFQLWVTTIAVAATDEYFLRKKPCINVSEKLS